MPPIKPDAQTLKPYFTAEKPHYAHPFSRDRQVYQIGRHGEKNACVARFMSYREATILCRNTQIAQQLGLPVAEVAMRRSDPETIREEIGLGKFARAREILGNGDTIVTSTYISGRDIQSFRGFTPEKWQKHQTSIYDALEQKYFTRLVIAGMADAREVNIILSEDETPQINGFIDIEFGAYGRNGLVPIAWPTGISYTLNRLRKESSWYAHVEKENETNPARQAKFNAMVHEQAKDILGDLRTCDWTDDIPLLMERTQTMVKRYQPERKSFAFGFLPWLALKPQQ